MFGNDRCGSCGFNVVKCEKGCKQIYKTNGFVSNRTRYLVYVFIGLLIALAFLTLHYIWGANNLGVNLDDQNLDRYFTLNFWRLAASGADLIVVFFIMVMFIFPVMCLMNVTCVIAFIALLVDFASLGFFAFDVTDCANVDHCDGDGIPILLGMDIAFLILVGTLIGRIFLLFLTIVLICQLKLLYKKCSVFYKTFKVEPVEDVSGCGSC